MKIIKSSSYPKWKLDRVLDVFEEKGLDYTIILQENINKSITKNLIKYSYGDYGGIISSHSNKYKENKSILNYNNISEEDLYDFIYKNPNCLHGLLILDEVEKTIYHNLEYFKLINWL